MKVISAQDLAKRAPYRDIVEALRAGFREKIETPVRLHYETTPVSTLLLMPAWSRDYTGLKTVVVKTDNAAMGLPTITANYLLIDNRTGAAAAIMDGTELTRRRTAAASALAADYLARPDAHTMLMVGAGALASHFVHAHASVRPIKTVLLYNRTFEKSKELADTLRQEGFAAEPVSDLEAAARKADVISCATSSTTPIIRGEWLKPGAHVDLAGAFKPSMRETDGETVRRSRVFVDTVEGARVEAGDLIQAQTEGKFDFSRVSGDLFALCRGEVVGRTSPEDITLFKSCGTALEDLATAIMVHLRS